jgi:hypothetical protein
LSSPLLPKLLANPAERSTGFVVLVDDDDRTASRHWHATAIQPWKRVSIGMPCDEVVDDGHDEGL